MLNEDVRTLLKLKYNTHFWNGTVIIRALVVEVGEFYSPDYYKHPNSINYESRTCQTWSNVIYKYHTLDPVTSDPIIWMI